MSSLIRSRGRSAGAIGLLIGALVSSPVGVAAAAAAAPSRLVSLVPSITETLFALGIGERVVGVSASCDFPEPARTLAKVGTFTAPVAEAIVALRPDLVLTSPSPGNQSAVRALERAGVRVAVVYGDGGIEEARQGMLAVAEAAGEGARGRDLVASIDAELEAVRHAVAGLPRPKVAIAVGREPLILAGPASYLGELVTAAGGDNVADAVGGRWPQVGLEYLVERRPEVIFDLSISMEEADSSEQSPSAMDREKALMQAWARLASVPAVAERRVYAGAGGCARAQRGSPLLRPGPRLGQAARLLAARLHPEVSGLAGSERCK
ncbi:MAG: ABC transporter substrate-binding protein [Deltaproteobacteria bacterium]|nr:ABC transporter substrate-binding protein [Deltaproteobacteria bacterium]